MKIGDLSRLTQTRVETIRYYEKAGLLPEPARTSANYRAYSLNHLEQLRFIRKARALGFSLEEVRELLRLSIIDPDDCASVHIVADAHLKAVNHKLKELRKMQVSLQQIIDSCSHGDTASCTILDSLSD